MARSDARRVANAISLLKNASASAAAFTDPLRGGNYHLAAEAANWNGASLTLQFKGPNDSAIAVAGVSLGANGNLALEVADGSELKAIITGAPTGVYADLVRVSAP